MNILVNANVILRYLLDDVPEMAEKVNAIIKDGAYTTPEILAEVLYVLIKVYKVEKREACSFSRVFLMNCMWTKRPLLNML